MSAAEDRDDRDVAPTASSTASSVSMLILDIVTQHLQRYVDGGLVLHIPVSMYAASLAVTFYEQQENRSAGGAVALTDGMLAELSDFVRNNIEHRNRRTSL